MRVALCSDTYHPIPDGVSKHLVDYRNELERRGHTVRVYTVFSSNDGLYGMPSFKFPFYPQYRVAFPVYDIYRDLGRFKPDVIHIHTPFVVGTMSSRFGRKRNIPVVGTYHTDFVNMSKTLTFPFARSILNLGFQYNMYLYRRLDKVITPSDIVAKRLKKFGNDSVVVHVGINLKRFVVSKKKDNFFLFLGRLTEDKGIKTILKAAALLPNVSFKIAGVGPLKDKVQDFTRSHKNVKYLGLVSEEEKIELLSKAKVFVSPSRAETFGISYVEALASGTPVIASNESRGIGILKEGVNGWIVRFGNPEELRDVISNLEKTDLKDFTERAWVSSSKFSIEATANSLESIYSKLIESKKLNKLSQ